jgi:hypothetical protein
MRGIVHHVDGQTGRPRARRYSNADLAGAGAKYRNDPAEVGRAGIGFHMLDARCGGGIETGDREVAVGCMPAHAPARSEQEAQPGPNRIAGSDQKDRTGMGIEKDRKELHSTLLLFSCFASAGLTEIIFYLCILQAHQTENYFFYAETKV